MPAAPRPSADHAPAAPRPSATHALVAPRPSATHAPAAHAPVAPCPSTAAPTAEEYARRRTERTGSLGDSQGLPDNDVAICAGWRTHFCLVFVDVGFGCLRFTQGGEERLQRVRVPLSLMLDHIA